MPAEGAFGAVDQRKLVNADGSVAYFAVKRLKRQDVPQEVCDTLYTTTSRIMMVCALSSAEARQGGAHRHHALRYGAKGTLACCA